VLQCYYSYIKRSLLYLLRMLILLNATLSHIHTQLLGTPTESIWPGVTRLPNWMKADVFPTWPEQSLGHQLALSGLSTAGLNLLQQLLTYDPAERITAKQALLHQYLTGTSEIRTIQVTRYVVDTTRHDTAASKGKHRIYVC
jgi:serine/threonine protein kinase